MRKTRADPYRVLFFGVSTLDSFHCHTVWTPTECGKREHTLTASNITDMSSHTHTHWQNWCQEWQVGGSGPSAEKWSDFCGPTHEQVWTHTWGRVCMSKHSHHHTCKCTHTKLIWTPAHSVAHTPFFYGKWWKVFVAWPHSLKRSWVSVCLSSLITCF